jgi:hypothetical protein
MHYVDLLPYRDRMLILWNDMDITARLYTVNQSLFSATLFRSFCNRHYLKLTVNDNASCDDYFTMMRYSQTLRTFFFFFYTWMKAGLQYISMDKNSCYIQSAFILTSDLSTASSYFLIFLPTFYTEYSFHPFGLLYYEILE